MMMTLNCYAEVFKQGIDLPESLKDMDSTLAANCGKDLLY